MEWVLFLPKYKKYVGSPHFSVYRIPHWYLWCSHLFASVLLERLGVNLWKTILNGSWRQPLGFMLVSIGNNYQATTIKRGRTFLIQKVIIQNRTTSLRLHHNCDKHSTRRPRETGVADQLSGAFFQTWMHMNSPKWYRGFAALPITIHELTVIPWNYSSQQNMKRACQWASTCGSFCGICSCLCGGHPLSPTIRVPEQKNNKLQHFLLRDLSMLRMSSSVLAQMAGVFFGNLCGKPNVKVRKPHCEKGPI